MSRRSTHQHLYIDYTVLIGILGVGVAFFYFFAGYPPIQFFIVVSTCVMYVLWGFVHHYKKGDVHPKIMIEYLLIALLAALLARGAIFQ